MNNTKSINVEGNIMFPSIELEEHKDKLIEMCKSLFLNVKDIIITDSQGRLHNYQNPNKLEFITFTNEIGAVSFKKHWFEFMMTDLINKIYSPDRKQSHVIKSNFMYHAFLYATDNFVKTHPIDHLYESWKKNFKN